MSLRRVCRELVLEAVVRRASATDAGDNQVGRLQVIVDESTMRLLNSFVRMGDLHAEGVTSVELLERVREPLPELDALYLMRPDASSVERVLADYRGSKPQHCQVHFAFCHQLPADLFARLAENPQLAPRVKSFVEVPVSFATIQDRGFHFDMPGLIPALFPSPDPAVVTEVAARLMDVCRCLQVTAAHVAIQHAQSNLCRSVAEQIQMELGDAKQPSTTEAPVPGQLLIVDRSIDVAATLVHEYTYEALVYDLLDGEVLDSDRNIVTMPGKEGREVLLSDADALWNRLRHLHLQDAQVVIQRQVDAILAQNQSKDASQVSTTQMLEMLRKTPELKESMERLELHVFLVETINRRLREEQLLNSLGMVEQDIACGVDETGRDVKGSSLRTQLSRALETDLSSEAKLRLCMLYFASMTNITEQWRQEVLEQARLDAEDQAVIMSMLRTRLMEVPDTQRHKQDKTGSSHVHRVTKEQAARFKRNARAEGSIQLSRFEPRVKELLERLVERQLSGAAFPALSGSDGGGGLRAAAMGAPVAPPSTKGGGWAFAAPPDDSSGAAQAGPEAEVTRRIVVFIIGGITHSELRAAAEVRETLPRGTEVLIGGTSILTPRRLIDVLRPSHNPFEDGDPEDLS